MDFKVNINETVKVKLTETGLNHLKRQRDELNRDIQAKGGQGLGEYESITDADGYVTFQLWDLMHTFGDILTMGFDVPFETNIIITNGKPIGN